MAVDPVRTTEQAQIDSFVSRLVAGERNPFLVYELCKRWRPASFTALMDRLPLGVNGATASEGWREYESTQR